MQASAFKRAFATVGLLFCALSSFAQTDPGIPQSIGGTPEEVIPGPPGTPPANLAFGWDVAVLGTTALASMPGYGEGTGRVAVFTRDASRIWVRSATLEAGDGIPGNSFGLAVALSDDAALVRAATGVYVFRRSRGVWRQVQKIAEPDGVSFAGIALGRRAAFIGTLSADQTGAVRVYRADGRGRFVRTQHLTARDGATGNGFGSRLALEDDTLVVSAEGDRDGRGAAYLFRRIGPFWFALQKLIAINGVPNDAFGASVAIGDGLIAVGAPNADRDPSVFGECPFAATGAVYVFARHRAFWSLRQQLERTGFSPPCVTLFGEEVAVNRRWLVTGTPTLFPLQFDGSTLFERIDGSFESVTTVASMEGDVPVSRLSGSTLVIGMWFDRGFRTGQGLIYELPRGGGH
jgi:hypothetical protein